MLNSQQKNAVRLAEQGHSFLLLGGAGTGKSFCVSSLVQHCREIGKRVELTCTTGIACSIYDLQLRATTVHRWSGIDDGRHTIRDIPHIIANNPKYVDVLQRIKATETLIIDECSMLSKKTFEALNAVCCLRQPGTLFGGIQLILAGDFQQLPPVPNVLYDDDGSYCFESALFSPALPHRVELCEIFRMRDMPLLKAVNEVASGNMSDETAHFIHGLKRSLPVEDDSDTVRLFSTNELVNKFNRNSILSFQGDLYEFESHDTGDKKHLDRIISPRKLWLKIGCPVILLRNISSRLVNGLRGTVVAITESGPTVHFPSVGITTHLEKLPFSVFNPRLNIDIAVRRQHPIKLAFGLTIHKSQGMTLERLEVDCQEIFKAGQLGVALGRATRSEGVRVVNFSHRAVIRQPEVVNRFMKEESSQVHDDNSCCNDQSRYNTSWIDIMYTIAFTLLARKLEESLLWDIVRRPSP